MIEGRIRVLHFLGDFDVGGYEIGVARLIKTLNSEAFVCKVVAFEDGPMRCKFDDCHVQVDIISKERSWDLIFLRRLYKQIREFKPHVIHCTGVTPNVYGGFAALLCRTPAVIVIHGEQAISDGAGARAIRTLGKLRTVQIVTVSNHLRKLLNEGHGLNGKCVTTILNGIEISSNSQSGRSYGQQGMFKPPDATPVVASIGTLRPVKNLENYLWAIKEVLQRGLSAQFLIIGDGPDRPTLENLCSELQINSSVSFLGYRMDMERLWPAIDIVVNSSNSEGISYVLLEAMAAGKPVVATRVGGNPELVRDGHSGIIVPPADPAALASAISELVLDSSRRRRMGEAGKQLAKTTFSQEQSTKQYESLYRDLCGA